MHNKTMSEYFNYLTAHDFADSSEATQRFFEEIYDNFNLKCLKIVSNQKPQGREVFKDIEQCIATLEEEHVDLYGISHEEVRKQLRYVICLSPILANSQVDPNVLVSTICYAVSLICINKPHNDNSEEGDEKVEVSLKNRSKNFAKNVATKIQRTITKENHAQILVEGITKGRYFASVAHLHISKTNPAGEISIVNVSDKKIRYDKRSRVWLVTQDKVLAMMKVIREDSDKMKKGIDACIKLDSWGFGKDSRWRKSDMHHNCYTYAIEKMEMLDIFFGKDWVDKLLTSITSRHTYSDEEINGIFSFLWK